MFKREVKHSLSWSEGGVTHLISFQDGVKSCQYTIATPDKAITMNFDSKTEIGNLGDRLRALYDIDFVPRGA